MYSYLGGVIGTALAQITNIDVRNIVDPAKAGRRDCNEDAFYGFAVPTLVSQIGFFTIC